MSTQSDSKPAMNFGKIKNQGYIIELADGGPWLKNDLTWTPIWDERGVWDERTSAELAISRSLLLNTDISTQ